jgi:hypothetical protein
MAAKHLLHEMQEAASAFPCLNFFTGKASLINGRDMEIRSA